MPGIAGIVSGEPPEICRARLERMVARIATEPFYVSGAFVAEDLGIYIGWAAHKDEISSRLPLIDRAGDQALVVVGGISPDAEELRRIASRDRDFGSSGATALERLFERRLPRSLRDLNARFSGLLVDRREATCHLFNDRYGMERIFIHETGEIHFASRAGALLAVLPAARDFDPVGLGEYLTCGCTLGDRSLYKDIRILPPASLWTLGPGPARKKVRYLTAAELEAGEPLEPGPFAEAVTEMFPGTVRRHAASRQAVGVSLTGGLDTRMIMACLDMPPGAFPCYTFAGMYRESYDVLTARKVAEACGRTFAPIVLGEEFLVGFPSHLERAVAVSDGYIGLPGAAALYVNALARQIAPVRLTGNYGSELLRNVRAFKSSTPAHRFYDAGLDPYLEQARETFAALEKGDPISFAMFLQAPCQGYGLQAVESSQVALRTPFLDNDLVELAYRGPRSRAFGLDLSTRIIERHRPELMRIESDFGYLGRWLWPISAVRRLWRLALFKVEYRFGQGTPARLARILRTLPAPLSPERAFLGRHKYQHFRQWTSRELSALIRDILGPGRDLPGVIDKAGLRAILSRHIDRGENLLREVDIALTLTIGARVFFRP